VLPVVVAWHLDEGICCPACALAEYGVWALLRRTAREGGEPPEPLHEVAPRARCAVCRSLLAA
jgi:hypothetical protein